MWPQVERSSAPRVAVIGGGISGLAAAHRLAELASERQMPLHILLFEAGDRLGGVIATERIDEFVIESGPDSMLSEKPWGVDLCRRLGLEEEIVGTREEWRRTYVVRRGRLCPLPDGFVLMAPSRLWPLIISPLFSWPGKLRMAMDLLLPRREVADESLAAFVRRRLGQEALARVAQPLVGGIYTADPERLSLAATMPRFLEMERQHRSLIAAMWAQRAKSDAASVSGARWSLFVSFRGGMQTIVERLSRRLPEGAIRLRSRVESIAQSANRWLVNGAPCDAVVLALPAQPCAALLKTVAPDLAGEIAAIPYASSLTVNLAYRRDDVPHPLDGFGFVVPYIEGRRIIAGTFSSLKYAGRAPADHVLLRAFVGGALQPEILELSDRDVINAVRSEFRALLNIRAEPVLERIARYPLSMPQYHVGHNQRLARIAELVAACPGLALAGNAYRGVGIPDCIHSGETAAASVLDHLERRSR